MQNVTVQPGTEDQNQQIVMQVSDASILGGQGQLVHDAQQLHHGQHEQLCSVQQFQGDHLEDVHGLSDPQLRVEQTDENSERAAEEQDEMAEQMEDNAETEESVHVSIHQPARSCD